MSRATSSEWGWNPQTECLSHKGMACLVCMAYAMHSHSTAMEDDESYTAATDRCNAMFVSSSFFKCKIECRDYEVAEWDHYCSCAHMAEVEVKALKEVLQHLQKDLEEQQKAASNYAVTVVWGPNRLLMYAKLHVLPPFTAARMTPAAMKQMACAAPAPAVAPAPIN